MAKKFKPREKSPCDNRMYPEMIYVQGDRFIFSGDNTEREVSEFYMSKYMVTQHQYEMIMGENPSNFKNNPDAPLCPVEMVNFYNVVAYCNEINKHIGVGLVHYVFLLNETDNEVDEAIIESLNSYEDLDYDLSIGGWIAPDVSNHKSFTDANSVFATLNIRQGMIFGLPTEVQWDFAAKGGINHDTYMFAGSDNPDEVCWYSGNSDSRTHAVGLLKPNSLGFYDMCGNVWSWTFTCRPG